MVDDIDEDMLAYAKDVMYAYKNLNNTEMWQENATPSQKALLDWLGNQQNRSVFFKDMLPKAQEAFIKARNGRDPNEVGSQERRAINVLRSQLAEYVAEAEKITVGGRPEAVVARPALHQSELAAPVPLLGDVLPEIAQIPLRQGPA